MNHHTITGEAGFHPLAELFPLIEGEAFAALVEDVRGHGVRHPVVMFEGMILDGRNRYLAAREAGVSIPAEDFTGDDPVGFVVSENVHRRHLTESQRAMVSGRIAKLPKGRPSENASIGAVSQSQAAGMMNVSRSSVQRAAEIIQHGTPELVRSVDAGEVSVAAASEVAKLPEVEQAEIVARGPQAVKAAARGARAPKAVRPAATGPSGLTREALEDEVVGLREESAELRQKLTAALAERDDLKGLLAEATADNQGAVIAKLQQQLRAAKYTRDEALAAVKRMEFRAKKSEARTKELENLPIDMGVQ